jgi:hypothetical protein
VEEDACAGAEPTARERELEAELAWLRERFGRLELEVLEGRREHRQLLARFDGLSGLLGREISERVGHDAEHGRDDEVISDVLKRRGEPVPVVVALPQPRSPRS